tara:strand:- start:7304 stop:8665 length:1362 start_codon:yes stop_codon:yes gene_type:complete
MNLDKYDWKVILSIATIAMLAQNTFSYVCQITMPILADRIADNYDISRAWLGLYLFIQNITSIITAICCGSFILRYGSVRISQWALLMMGGSLFIVSIKVLWLYPIAAILLGLGGVLTPASSHLLAKVCPPKIAALIFSVKQTGVPLGSLMGGLLIPFLLGVSFYISILKTSFHIDAFGAAFITGMIVYIIVLFLQPVRDYFDSDRNPDEKLSYSDVTKTMKTVISTPQLRDLAFGSFSFGGLQSIFAGFFILFLIDGLGFNEVEAGMAFAIASFTAVGARILWGYIGSIYLSARIVLGFIGIFSSIASILTGLYDESWSYSLIVAIAILYNITALSWHGILLAEIARLSSRDTVAGITGGVLAFTSISMMVYPAIYGILLGLTGSYATGFLLSSIPAFIGGIILLRRPVETSWIKIIFDYLNYISRIPNLIYGFLLALIGITIGLVTGFIFL